MTAGSGALMWAGRMIAVVLGLLAAQLHAGEVTVAAAANFTGAVQQLAPLFERQTGHQIKTSFGSTGKLYAQVMHGAPFDVFLAADDRHARKLIEQGFAVPGSAFIYARGRLVLWAGLQKQSVPLDQQLKQGQVTRLAIANPATAPYGQAAVEVLQAMHLYERLEPKLVRGDNIAQALQFVYSGNASLGFVAYAQVLDLPEPQRGAVWLVPEHLHRPIRQEAVLLKAGANNEAAQAWLEFLRSPAALAVLRKLGYGVPGDAEPAQLQ